MPKCGRRTEAPSLDIHRGRMMEPGSLTKHAPFGTNFTPTIRMKIIGGKPVYVREKTGFGNKLNTTEQSGTDATNQQMPSSVTNENSESERNKQVWSSHSVLPPISPREASLPPTKREEQQNRYSNSAPVAVQSYSPQKMSTTPSTPQKEWNEGQGQSYLPKEPIALSKTEELGLLHNLSTSLQHHDSEILKQIYNELTINDRNLTGWVTFTDLMLTMQKLQVTINTDDLRLTAAMFVSPEQPGSVNYEKFLSFIAAALKRGKERKSTYFEPETNEDVLKAMSIDTRPNRPSGELAGAQGKLMRMVQSQLALGDGPIDIDQLRQAFTMADRLHRDTLSHGEIKEICYRMRVPLQESIINQILDRCQTTGDGQYRWMNFIDFLEKVQPSGTGLPIPDSKKPTEYAKKFPHPNPSWPKTDFESTEAPASYTQHVQRQLQAPYASAPASLRSSGLESVASKKMTSDGVQTDEDLLPGAKNGGDDPWFERFTKLAEALYRNDLDRRGSIKAEECRWLVSEYNDIYGLNLTKLFINDCIQKNTTATGTNINNLLKGLLTAGQ